MNRKKTTHLVILSVLFAVLLVVTGNIFLKFGDIFYRFNVLYGKKEKCDSVVIVGIDSLSIKELGKFPWPRSRFAELTEKISSYSPRVIALNFFFPKKADINGNDSLKTAFSEVDNLVLPFKAGDISKEPPSSMAAIPRDLIKEKYNIPVKEMPFRANNIYTSAQLFRPTKDFYLEADNSGFLNISTLRSSGSLKELIHVIQVGSNFFPSLCMSALKSFYGVNDGDFTLSGNYNVTIGNKSVALSSYAGSLLLNFRGAAGSIETVSAADVLNGRVDSSVLKDKLVFVGMTDPYSSPDQFETPVGKHFPGVEVWATSAADIIEESWITRCNGGMRVAYWVLVFLIFPGSVFAAVFNRRKTKIVILAGAAVTVVSIASSYIFFNRFHCFWNPEFHVYAWIFSLVWFIIDLSGSPSQKPVS